MKRQNGVVLSGLLADVQAEKLQAGAIESEFVRATLITDDKAYGGYHPVIFPAEFALDVQAYWALTAGRLEATVEGWLRSSPGQAGSPPVSAVIVDRVIFLNITEAQRAQVARHKATLRSKGKR